MVSRIIEGEGVSAREIVESCGTSAELTEGSCAGAMYVVPSSGLWGAGVGVEAAAPVPREALLTSPTSWTFELKKTK